MTEKGKGELFGEDKSSKMIYDKVIRKIDTTKKIYMRTNICS